MTLPDVVFPLPDHVDALQKALGAALLRFQHVEGAMFHIAHALMETDYETSSLVFFHSKSAENKLSLLSKLIDAKVEQRVRNKLWKPLKDEISDIIGFRNAISHFEIVLTDGSKVIPPSEFNYVVADHHLNEYERRSGRVRGLSVESIVKYGEQTRALTYRLIYFLIDHVPGADRAIDRLPDMTRAHLTEMRKGPRPPGY